MTAALTAWVANGLRRLRLVPARSAGRFLVVLSCLIGFGLVAPSAAMAETRTLKLYYIHTKEKAEIVFKRNGRYDKAGLAKLNRFLRDWRRNEPTKMDPRLFDLLWEVYRQTGASSHINVVSAYRSPATNNMLRRTRGGQADKSQHMVGRAIDFYIPGVKLSKIREVSMRMQGGGVGYYPSSGSPFVHIDVAGVRAWPRMTRPELVRLFPNGKTLHLPADGKPLPGYQTALAEYKSRKGAIASVASANVASGSGAKRSGGLLAALFGGGDEDEEPEAIAAAAPAPAPAPKRQAEVTEVAALPGVDSQTPDAAFTETAVAKSEVLLRVPVPAPRPRIEPQVTEVALAPPVPEAPAQAEIEAFVSAGTAEAAIAQATESPLLAPGRIRDLSGIRAPVPQFLAERAVKPEPVLTQTQVAALAPVSPVAKLETIPVPTLNSAAAPAVESSGPPVAEIASVATAALIEALPEMVPVPAQPVEVAAAVPVDGFVPLPIRRPGARVTIAAAELAVSDLAVASLEPVGSVRRPASVFETAATPIRKGARPKIGNADDGQVKSVRTEPKLTEKIISRWALAQEKVATLPMETAKTQRFVTAQLRSAPKEVYAAGFAPGGGELPHSRFSGSAVNFISMARFNQSN